MDRNTLSVILTSIIPTDRENCDFRNRRTVSNVSDELLLTVGFAMGVVSVFALYISFTLNSTLNSVSLAVVSVSLMSATRKVFYKVT